MNIAIVPELGWYLGRFGVTVNGASVGTEFTDTEGRRFKLLDQEGSLSAVEKGECDACLVKPGDVPATLRVEARFTSTWTPFQLIRGAEASQDLVTQLRKMVGV